MGDQYGSDGVHTPGVSPGVHSKAEALFLPPGDLSDNVQYLEWINQCIRALQVGAISLNVGSAAANAALRKVSPHIAIAGMPSRYRANRATKPVEGGAQAMVAAVKYLWTARNTFEAIYMPELEQAGYRPRVGAFQFRAA